MAEFTQECEIGQYFRKWMLAVDSVQDHCANRILDTIPNDDCDRRFIYFTMEDAQQSDTFCDEGFEEYDFIVEVCGPINGLPMVRKVRSNLMLAAQNYQRGEPFGDASFWVQSIEIIKVKDGYQSMMAAYIPDLVFSVFAVRITP